MLFQLFHSFYTWLPVDVLTVGTVEVVTGAERDGLGRFTGVDQLIDHLQHVAGTDLVGFVQTQPAVGGSFDGKGDVRPAGRFVTFPVHKFVLKVAEVFMELGLGFHGLSQTAVSEGVAMFPGTPGVPVHFVVDQFGEHTSFGVEGKMEI